MALRAGSDSLVTGATSVHLSRGATTSVQAPHQQQTTHTRYYKVVAVLCQYMLHYLCNGQIGRYCATLSA